MHSPAMAGLGIRNNTNETQKIRKRSSRVSLTMVLMVSLTSVTTGLSCCCSQDWAASEDKALEPVA